jgi:hypothetical protein
MTSRLQNLIEELEVDGALECPEGLRARIEALDRLDAYPLDRELSGIGGESIESELFCRARALRTKLEFANRNFYQTIRDQIRRGAAPHALLPWIFQSNGDGGAMTVAPGEGYDYLDELLSGVLRFAEPVGRPSKLAAEMVPYQPTPARHILDLLHVAQMTEQDVLMDLGSGLGHVSLLAAICTRARSIGIEVEAAYVRCAQQSADELKLKSVTFRHEDAREADLSCGTVFYLYTPFRGAILRAVLDAMQREASRREIRVSTFGPCTPIVAAESWLMPIQAREADRINVFCSRN